MLQWRFKLQGRKRISRLNILFVTQNYPYPGVPHAGGQDYWRMIDHFRQRHRVYVLTFDDPTRPMPASALESYVEAMRIIRYARSARQKIIMNLAAMAQGYRHFRIGRRAWMMRRLVADWCAHYQIDVLHCGWTECGAYLDASPLPRLKVLDEVDVRFVADDRLVALGLMTSEQAARRKADELAYCRNADVLIARSEADANILRGYLPDKTILTLPSAGLVEDLIGITPEEAQPDTVIFVGALNRDANRDAALWLTRDIWPLVRQQHPQAQLLIVGADPPTDVLATDGQLGITVTGYQASLRPWYAQASVVVAPMRTTGGWLNKIMDGLTAGRPVVATSNANRGTNADPVRIADTEPDLAQSIIDLLEQPAQWREVAMASRDYAIRHFDWRSKIEALENVYLRYVSDPQKH